MLQDSTRLILRLMPCDVVFRIAPVVHHMSAEFEVELAKHLAKARSPVALLDPRVEPRVHLCDGFAINIWTYYERVSRQPVAPADYARALERLHVGLREIHLVTPHFRDRVAEAQQIAQSRELSPALSDSDRELLSSRLRDLQRAIVERGAAEQLLHGEPHDGNVLNTKYGPLFIDLETSCRGPVEIDIAYAPEAVSEHYPNVDVELLNECRGLCLAMVAAWRWDRDDQFPDGRRSGDALLRALRDGPPWSTVDAVCSRPDGP